MLQGQEIVALPPSEELFRKKVILEAAMEVLQKAIEQVKKSARDKRTVLTILHLTSTTLTEQLSLLITRLLITGESAELNQKRIRLDIMVHAMNQAIKGCETLPHKQACIKYLGDCGKEFNQQWQFLERELMRQRTERNELLESHIAATSNIVRDSTNTPDNKKSKITIN